MYPITPASPELRARLSAMAVPTWPQPSASPPLRRWRGFGFGFGGPAWQPALLAASAALGLIMGVALTTLTTSGGAYDPLDLGFAAGAAEAVQIVDLLAEE